MQIVCFFVFLLFVVVVLYGLSTAALGIRDGHIRVLFSGCTAGRWHGHVGLLHSMVEPTTVLVIRRTAGSTALQLKWYETINLLQCFGRHDSIIYTCVSQLVTSSVASFRKKLKSYLFAKSYSLSLLCLLGYDLAV